MSSLSTKDFNKYTKKLDNINGKIKIAENLIYEDTNQKILRPGLNEYTFNYLMSKLQPLYNIRNDISNKLT